VWPPMAAVGAAGDPARTEQVGAAIGRELAALGIGWNFAPVLAANTNPANPVIGNRAFAGAPGEVVAHALAFWRGLRAAGVAGCGKHFPGHGDTRVDSHHALPVVDHGLDRLRAVELAPFAAAARAGMEAIMTAHVVFPALDDAEPVTLSPKVIARLLRGELGYAGMVVSDDLGMRAVADRYPIDEIVVRAVRAGCDHLLVREPDARTVAVYEALVRACEADAGFRALVAAAAGRVAAFKRNLAVPMPLRGDELRRCVGPSEHLALAASFGAGSTPGGPAASPVATG
jgi:beta-N-acetylhexosaminidase